MSCGIGKNLGRLAGHSFVGEKGADEIRHQKTSRSAGVVLRETRFFYRETVTFEENYVTRRTCISTLRVSTAQKAQMRYNRFDSG